MVTPHAHVFSRTHFGATLTQNNVSRNNRLVSEFFKAESTSCRISSVSRATARFLMSHFLILFLCCWSLFGFFSRRLFYSTFNLSFRFFDNRWLFCRG